MTDPWYKDGLRFECTRCGDCCTGTPGYVWVNREEVEAIAAARGDSYAEALLIYTKKVETRRSLREKSNGECIFFERGQGCTIYAIRPRQCRTWPFWQSNLDSPEAWEKTCKVCPGSGTGPLIPVEEITARLKVIRI